MHQNDWRPGSARTYWGSLCAPPNPLAAVGAMEGNTLRLCILLCVRRRDSICVASILCICMHRCYSTLVQTVVNEMYSYLVSTYWEGNVSFHSTSQNVSVSPTSRLVSTCVLKCLGLVSVSGPQRLVHTPGVSVPANKLCLIWRTFAGYHARSPSSTPSPKWGGPPHKSCIAIVS